MARRPQIGLNVPADVYQWVAGMESWMELSKTRMGLTGFVSFLLLDGPGQGEALQLASLLDRELASWEEIRAFAGASAQERGNIIRQLQRRVRDLAGVSYQDPASPDVTPAQRSLIVGSPVEDETSATEVVRDAAAQKPRSRRRRKAK